MSDITRIQIKGRSGYCPVQYMFADKLTILPDSIRYEYRPEMPTEDNPSRTWSYKTDNPAFAQLFDEMSAQVAAAIASEEWVAACDAGEATFAVTYADKTRAERTFTFPDDGFAPLVALIKKMVPRCERTPEVLDWLKRG